MNLSMLFIVIGTGLFPQTHLLKGDETIKLALHVSPVAIVNDLIRLRMEVHCIHGDTFILPRFWHEVQLYDQSGARVPLQSDGRGVFFPPADKLVPVEMLTGTFFGQHIHVQPKESLKSGTYRAVVRYFARASSSHGERLWQGKLEGQTTFEINK